MAGGLGDLSVDHPFEGVDETFGVAVGVETVEGRGDGFDRRELVSPRRSADAIATGPFGVEPNLGERLQSRVVSIEFAGLRPRSIEHDQRVGTRDGIEVFQGASVGRGIQERRLGSDLQLCIPSGDLEVEAGQRQTQEADGAEGMTALARVLQDVDAGPIGDGHDESAHAQPRRSPAVQAGGARLPIRNRHELVMVPWRALHGQRVRTRGFASSESLCEDSGSWGQPRHSGIAVLSLTDASRLVSRPSPVP